VDLNFSAASLSQSDELFRGQISRVDARISGDVHGDFRPFSLVGLRFETMPSG
jgi:hypothetical protein